MNEIRIADLPRDTKDIRSLWLEYLAWSNDELDAKHGFRLPINKVLEHDPTNIAKYQPPSGCILLAIEDDEPVGIVCMKQIGPTTAEVKRMYVRPEKRRAGLGRGLLEHLIKTAKADGYNSIRLDSPEFMTAAHALYGSSGFVDIGPYAESEIPDEYKAYWIFMEKTLV